MPLDSWLPVGFQVPGGARVRLGLCGGVDWQLYESQQGDRVLVVKETLANRWVNSGLMDEGSLGRFQFCAESLLSLTSQPGHTLAPCIECKSPDSKSEAMAFAAAMRATRAIDADSPLQDAIFVERLSRLLPTYSLSSRVSDDILLGSWLTGGASVSVFSYRRLQSMMSWLSPRHLRDVVNQAGFEIDDASATHTGEIDQASGAKKDNAPNERFSLAGRPELERFFLEHIIDIVENPERYGPLGIESPSAIVLHGPPGCGKTFAVQRLVEYLGWPSFEIDASSVASPFIHETSRKVAEVFEKAIQTSPSVLLIDEMESFLADRQMGTGSSHHRVEEVAEFLRRIPEAIQNHVLIVAMTNRIEMIDPAILRRGRFDHVVKVGMASDEEVRALLNKLISELPHEDHIEVSALAAELAGRPLSDVAFVVREGARLAARSGKDKLDQTSLVNALQTAPARSEDNRSDRRIGFV